MYFPFFFIYLSRIFCGSHSFFFLLTCTRMELCQTEHKIASPQKKHLLSSSSSLYENDTHKRAKTKGDSGYRSIDRFLAVTALLVHCSSFMDAQTTTVLRALCVATLRASSKFMPIIDCACRDDLERWPCAKYTKLRNVSGPS